MYNLLNSITMSVNVNIQNLTTKSFGGGAASGQGFSMIGVQSLQLFYDNYITGIRINGVMYGMTGTQSSDELEMGPGEYFVRIEIRAGVIVDGLEFTTNTGKLIAGGGAGGALHVVTGKVLALGGRTGNVLERLEILGDFS